MINYKAYKIKILTACRIILIDFKEDITNNFYKIESLFISTILLHYDLFKNVKGYDKAFLALSKFVYTTKYKNNYIFSTNNENPLLCQFNYYKPDFNLMKEHDIIYWILHVKFVNKVSYTKCTSLNRIYMLTWEFHNENDMDKKIILLDKILKKIIIYIQYAKTDS